MSDMSNMSDMKTASEAAVILDLSMQEMNSVCRRGKKSGLIKSEKIDNVWYISQNDIDDMLYRRQNRAKFIPAGNSYT